jgi:diguanylate cyclase (GGDEF)-like protein
VVWFSDLRADNNGVSGRLQRLRGIEIPDERHLAGQLTGVVYIVAAMSVGGLLAMPHVEAHAVWPVAAIAAAAALWGVITLTLIDWTRIPGWAVHASTLAGLVAGTSITALMGGSGSSARFLLLLPLVYPAAFFPPREAWPYFVLVIAAWSSPLLYDPDALDTDLLAEMLIVVPVCFLIMFLMASGKHQMVILRVRADELARRDPLTGLANRRALMEALARSVSGRRAMDRAGLLVLDLDSFKSINTAHGHPGGDLALRAVARALRGVARELDLPGRLGGDEFALIVREADHAGMAVLADRVLAAIRGADTGLPGVQLHASAGWALCPDDAWTADELLAAADRALLAVKAAGKDAARHAAYS